ncbi:MAG: hypothetical protein QW575_07935 [Thermoproteota archaeon]
MIDLIKAFILQDPNTGNNYQAMATNLFKQANAILQSSSQAPEITNINDPYQVGVYNLYQAQKNLANTMLNTAQHYQQLANLIKGNNNG